MLRQERRKTISTLWIVSTVALWILVLFETGLLLFLLRALGELRQQGVFPGNQGQSSEEWGLEVGEQAPSFVATDYEGKPVQLDDFRGKRRVLAFISPGCSACSGTLDALNALSQEDEHLAILVLGDPDRHANQAYAAKHNAQIAILAPGPGFDKEVYRIMAIPFLFLLDEMGVIRAKRIVNNREDLQTLLEPFLSQLSVSR